MIPMPERQKGFGPEVSRALSRLGMVGNYHRQPFDTILGQMKSPRGPKVSLRVLFFALMTGLAWAIPTQSAFACHAFSFESATYTVTENSPNVAVVVTRKTDHQPTGYPSSVNVSTTDESAESGTDYTAFNQAISFGPTEAAKRIEITLKDDTAYEGSETFSVRLAQADSPTECTLNHGGFEFGSPATITIQDNDPQSSKTSPTPASKPVASPKPGPVSSAPPATKNPSPVASPTDEEIGPNISGDVPKQKDSGLPVKTILIIGLIVLGVGGAIGLYYYMGTRD